jgi:hypothetical protein
MNVIGQAHALVHQQGVQRIQTSMRVGTRYNCPRLGYVRAELGKQTNGQPAGRTRSRQLRTRSRGCRSCWLSMKRRHNYSRRYWQAEKMWQGVDTS